MKTFAFITEADARVLEPGSTVELVRGGHVTPLARDTLRERRVTLVEAGLPDAGGDLAPTSPVTRVAVGSDHVGLALKRTLLGHLRSRGLQAAEFGALDASPVDYPDVAAAVGRAVASGEADAGIVIDGAGLGSAIAANKVRGIRAAMCTDETLARYAREHNGANVLTLGATLITADHAIRIVDVWLATAMREPRYIRRLAKIQRIERS